ncbi:hypothetical protein PCI56_07805 [Plesiomonas shigelloides subsp. oncorhynchi]|nr:hypothetical protein [Plesiomonas shigelloides]
MSVAVIGAIAIGQWPEAAMVLFLFAVAEKLEDMSLTRAGEAVKSLMALAPETAWIQREGNGLKCPWPRWRWVPAYACAQESGCR